MLEAFLGFGDGIAYRRHRTKLDGNMARVPAQQLLLSREVDLVVCSISVCIFIEKGGDVDQRKHDVFVSLVAVVEILDDDGDGVVVAATTVWFVKGCFVLISTSR